MIEFAHQRIGNRLKISRQNGYRRRERQLHGCAERVGINALENFRYIVNGCNYLACHRREGNVLDLLYGSVDGLMNHAKGVLDLRRIQHPHQLVNRIFECIDDVVGLKTGDRIVDLRYSIGKGRVERSKQGTGLLLQRLLKIYDGLLNGCDHAGSIHAGEQLIYLIEKQRRLGGDLA